MKKTALLLSFFISFYGVAQQASIKGRVLDSQDKAPIAYANISLLSPKDSLISGAISNEKGKFVIKHIPIGKYKLQISFMGYKTVEIQHLILTKGMRDLGTKYLEPDTENLKEVVISNGKSPISYKVDRKVINASAFPEASVALDLLENVPELKVDVTGKITYRDRMTFSIFINGKPVSNGADRLRNLNTKLIDKIEIITNPSAKYAAQGTGGIINIILKKNRLKGYNISSSLRTDTKKGFQWLFNIGKSTKKSEWYVNGNYAKYEYKQDMDLYQNIYRPYAPIIKSHSATGNHARNNYLEVGYNYDITGKDMIDLSFNVQALPNKENHYKTEQILEIPKDGSATHTYALISRDVYTYQYFGPVMSFTHKFDKEGNKKIELSVDYSTYLKNFEELSVDALHLSSGTVKQGYYYNEQNEEGLAVDLDFSYDFDKYSVESGLSVDTDFIPKTLIKNGYVDDQDEITPFAGAYHYQYVKFARNVYAAYADMSTKWKKWELKTGLRYEHTMRIADYTFNYSDDAQQEVKQPYNNDFGRWFPSFHLKYGFSDSKEIAFSYTKRIERPNYFSLMPVRQYGSPYSYSLGNADLQPEYIDSYEIKYHKNWDKDYFSVSAYWYHHTDNVTNYQFIDADNLVYSQQINSGKRNSIGSDISINYHPWAWWNINLSTSLYYNQIMIDFHQMHANKESWMSYVNLNQDFNLPKRFKVKIKAQYTGPGLYVQQRTDPYFVTQLSLQKNLGKHWKLFVYTNNIWGDIRNKTYTESDELYQERRFVRPQYAGAKLSYNFSNRK